MNDKANLTYLVTLSYLDQGALGGEAFRLIMPRGWQYKGGIYWRNERPLLPVSLCFRVNNPKELQSIEYFPDQAHFWVQSRGLFVPYDYTAQMQQWYAANYPGYYAICPMDAISYIKNIVIPQYRRTITNLRIVKVDSLNTTDIVQNLYNQLLKRPQGPLPEQIGVDAAKMTINYQEDGKEIEEELWALIISDTFFTTPQIEMGSGVTLQSTFWYADWLWSFKKEKSKFSFEDGKLFMTMLSSFQWNKDWLSRYSQLLANIWSQHLQAVMERHEIITQTQNEIARIINTSFDNQQKAMDRIAKEWSRTIRGTDTYSDSRPGLAEFKSGNSEAGVELPNGYDYAWVNNSGDYVLTDSIGFNPNIDLGTSYNWQKLERKH